MRDNFTKQTIDILGKRVGFLCSNPRCRKHTVGPNELEDKVTIIGIAAHITAASPGGPRFDENLMEEQRRSVSNGLWLCANCATLIDRNPDRYSKEQLLDWKRSAENEMLNKILGDQHEGVIPFLEADLIRSFWGRSNRGYSYKNPIEEHEGMMVMVPGNEPIIFWNMHWLYSLTIHNNSSTPAYNISIKDAGETNFTFLTELNNVNNLPPYQSLDLEARYEHMIESTYKEADKILEEKIPGILNGLRLEISYHDDRRNLHTTYVRILDGKIYNQKG